MNAPAMNNDTVYVSFSAEVNPNTAESLLRTAADLCNQGTSTLYLMLSTPGGSVMHGIHIHNVLKALPMKVVTHNVGAVNSIGNVIFLAGAERYASPCTSFMFHGVGFDVQNARFEEKVLTERLEAIRVDQRKMAEIIRGCARFADPQEVEGLFLQATTKDPQYAKDKGIIHDIREVKVPAGAPVLQLVFKR